MYSCIICNYSTNIKCNYNKHLKTKKHLKNEDKITPKSEKSINFAPNCTDLHRNCTELHQIAPNCTGSQNQTVYVCNFCDKEFTRKSSLMRHIEHRCGAKNKNLNYKELFDDLKEQLQKEKQESKKQIELLLTKVGNTTTHINNTQNIQLNSYGNEDLSHITNNLKNQLLAVPYTMIPKMIEAVHFNENKPENKNIVLTNKKDNKIKIFSNNKWIYKDKESTINDLVDGKYFILDTHYESIDKNKELNGEHKINYEKFRTFFDEKDKKLHDDLKRECEIVLLNNR